MRDQLTVAVAQAHRPVAGHGQLVERRLEGSRRERRDQEVDHAPVADDRHRQGHEPLVGDRADELVADRRLPRGQGSRRCPVPLDLRNAGQRRAVGRARVEEHLAGRVGEEEVGTERLPERLRAPVEQWPLRAVVHQRRQGHHLERPDPRAQLPVHRRRDVARQAERLLFAVHVDVLQLADREVGREGEQRRDADPDQSHQVGLQLHRCRPPPRRPAA
jgi:hypothetical protein